MGAYNLSLSNKTTSTTDDNFTFVTAASGQDSRFSIYEVFLGGEASSATKLRYAFDRSTGGTTGASAYTLVPLDENGETGAEILLSCYGAWTSQPTLSGSRVLTPTFEAAGGQYKWWAVPNRPIQVGTGAAAKNLSGRSLSGVAVISGDIKIERV